ncbi:MAG: histidine kinase [Ardenticatenaceae bacterium]|nr:histidine kinase [Ardenticatenaceae bacterium]
MRRLFEINHTVILAIYGQVFVVLGLSILLRRSRHSRLELARSLPWLAGFGLLHGFHEWGLIFIPTQALHLVPSFVELLQLLHTGLLALSFMFLFQFAVEALPGARPHWQRVLPMALLVIWVAIFIFPGFVTLAGLPPGDASARAIARYALGLPAALLGAWALRRQSTEQIAALQVPALVRTMRVAAAALFAYGLVAGLIPSPAPFWPASVLNTARVEAFAVIPVPLWRSLVGAVLAIAMIRTLEIFDVEVDRLIAHMEEAQVLATERERIARELHDGTIQTLYAAGLLAESVQKGLPEESQAWERQTRVVTVINEAISALRQTISDLRAPETANLSAALKQVARDVQARCLTPVALELALPEGRGLAPRRASHILAVVQEALSNSVRHARCQHMTLGAVYEASGDMLRLWIRDDGVGLRPDTVVGYGLRNMRDRARLLGGTLTIMPADTHGTCVTLTVPWEELT